MAYLRQVLQYFGVDIIVVVISNTIIGLRQFSHIINWSLRSTTLSKILFLFLLLPSTFCCFWSKLSVSPIMLSVESISYSYKSSSRLYSYQCPYLEDSINRTRKLIEDILRKEFAPSLFGEAIMCLQLKAY